MRDSLTDEELAALPRPAGHGQWGRTDLVLADLVDAVNRVRWAVAAYSGQVKQAPKAPAPYPRPGVATVRSGPSEKATRKVAELREGHRRRQEAERQSRG